MKFEENTVYRRRDWNPERVGRIDSDRGIAYSASEENGRGWWVSSGQFHAFNTGPNDLIAPWDQLLTYDEAKEAHAAGARVEQRCNCGDCERWYPFEPSGYPNYEFRLAPVPASEEAPDPYAHLKTAQAAGKVIQEEDNGGRDWWDLENPKWTRPPDRYRVKPDELKIEAGKEYQTRDGRKVRIYTTESGSYSYPIHGSILGLDGEWRVSSWMASGAFEADCIPEDTNREDIIAPWTDTPAPYDNWDKGYVPSWANWQAMTEHGFWCFYENKPTLTQSVWTLVDSGCGNLPERCYPTNFDGTWEQSLQPRPL